MCEIQRPHNQLVRNQKDYKMTQNLENNACVFNCRVQIPDLTIYGEFSSTSEATQVKIHSSLD